MSFRKVCLILELTEAQHEQLLALLHSFGAIGTVEGSIYRYQIATPEQCGTADPAPVPRPATTTVAPRARKAKDEEAPVTEVIELLNCLCDRRFQVTRYNTVFINQRWREGFRLPDFEAAILNMRKLWGSDPEKRAWLRPETLFGNKMAGYVQAGRPVNQKADVKALACPICKTVANNSSSVCIKCGLPRADFNNQTAIEAHSEWYQAMKGERR
jgi:uncharacterized phage protein (TIGR02220 family)